MSTFNGKITEISEIRTGVSNGKDWASLEFEVTENKDKYPQIGLFGYFKNGEYVNYAKEFKNNFKIGDEVTVDFNLKCIEYEKEGQKRKFYKTEAWRVTKLETKPETPFETVKQEDLTTVDDDDSGLPF